MGAVGAMVAVVAMVVVVAMVPEYTTHYSPITLPYDQIKPAEQQSDAHTK